MSDLADPVAALGTVADPALRARLASAVAQFLAAVTREIYAMRNDAVIEHRPSGTVRQVASQVDLSPSRVHQITSTPPAAGVIAETKPGPASSLADPAPTCAAPAVQPPVSGPLVSGHNGKTAAGADSNATVATTPGVPS